jgi:ATP-dependent helicase Lhr and Lhr-like helicase
MFHRVLDTWFQRRFSAPTPAQQGAWPAIAAGRDTLITAPTGSGKTLAAFLACLDRLVRRSLEGSLEDRTYVLYVSPLKALSNDVRRNLEEPLAEIEKVAAELGCLAGMGNLLPGCGLSGATLGLRTAVRTGDTTTGERREMAKRPPHVLVTTPESLFILLTSESGRRGLRGVETVIVDEIHALVPDKRGAHLALSLERLEQLVAPGRLQRVGLSATIRPIETACRLLVGGERPLPEVVDAGQRRDLDLKVEILDDELGAVCTHEQWAEIYDRLAALARTHRSTLVFVNTRRLVERVTHQLGERLGVETVAAHHGSLSRARRFEAERRLKSGELKLVVATASLELGIDVGAIDLCCLIGSPRAIATGLQRVGRSGHAVGGTPKGRLFPLTRDQLVECAALVRAARAGEIDRVGLRDAPLDILAQQVVAACACEEWDEDALYELFRRAAPYQGLARADFDAVVDVLAEGIATSRGRAGAMVHRDGVARRLRARRGSRLAAITSGGAIPDNANYDVILEPEGTLIGNVEEDFAIESMAGDVILLGNSSWRIRRVESGRVRVEDAAGAAPTIPFWLGEAPARTRELSAAVSALRAEVADRLAAGDDEDLLTWLAQSCALDRGGATLVRDYLAAGRAALGALPTQTQVIAERFFDDSGGTQLVIHAPFGGRINRAWGMALRKRFCRSFDFELQAAATDDGLLLSLGPQHSFPLDAVFEMVRPEAVEELLTQAALQAPMFETRWRWNAMRSLALLRRRGGKKVPPALQRMRAQDLLAATFPAQTACQDNHGAGPVEIPDHFLVRETVRDCLVEAMDAAGLREVLAGLQTGRIGRLACEVPEPSPLSHEILNANPYAFLDDAPLEERRSRAVSVRRGLPAEVVERLGGFDDEAVRAVIAEAVPEPRTADELHDLLLELGALPAPQAQSRGWSTHFESLLNTHRATRATWSRPSPPHPPGPPLPLPDPPGRGRGEGSVLTSPLPPDTGRGEGSVVCHWVAAERRTLVSLASPGAAFVPDVAEPPARRAPPWNDRETAVAELVRARLGLVGPTTAQALATDLGLPVDDVEAALPRVELGGAILRGQFSAAAGPPGVLQWCDRRLLARVHRLTVAGLRREIEPVTVVDYLRFLLRWQHAAPETRLAGRDGLRELLGQLQGFEAAAGAWEREILPARLHSYDPRWLDDLCLGGEIAWGRLEARPDGTSVPSRAAAIALVQRRDLGWLLAPREGLEDHELSAKAQDVLGFLRRAGASFLEDIGAGVRRLRAEVEEALWELVAAGRVTGDGFAGLRALLPAAAPSGGGARYRFYARWTRQSAPRLGAGRWALLVPPAAANDESPTPQRQTIRDEERMESLARQYIRRYGVVFRDLLGREALAPPWRELVRIYRRLEMRGELRGGRLVASFVGEQFAAPEALDALRAVRRDSRRGQMVRLSACDPLNLVGVLTPGPRIPATLANHVVFEDGLPAPDKEPGDAEQPPSDRVGQAARFGYAESST